MGFTPEQVHQVVLSLKQVQFGSAFCTRLWSHVDEIIRMCTDLIVQHEAEARGCGDGEVKVRIRCVFLVVRRQNLHIVPGFREEPDGARRARGGGGGKGASSSSACLSCSRPSRRIKENKYTSHHT